MEAPLIGSLIASHLKQKNGITEVCLIAILCILMPQKEISKLKTVVFICQILKNTVIPEVPMFIPHFPLQGSILSSCCLLLIFCVF